jgi:hypothetical protein
MVGKGLLALLVLWTAILLFAPKKELYFLLEKRWEPEGVVVSGERIQETPFGLVLEGGELYYEGIDLGHFRRITLHPYLWINRIDIEEFTPAKTLEILPEISLHHARILYHPWRPKTLRVFADGSFGKVKGTIDWSKKMIRLRWIEFGEIQRIRPYLKKDEEGWYYEQSF